MTMTIDERLLLLGWKPSLPDARDVPAFRPDAVLSLAGPETFSLRAEMPPVYDQGQLGSCTANAIAALLQYETIKAGADMGVPSRLFLYYLERVREGSVSYDSGAFGRDGFASLRKTGCPPEADWPYDISRFTETPPELAYTDALQHRIKHYVHPNVRSRIAEAQSLLINKQPIAFGFAVFESFRQIGASGFMPMPQPGERVLGGHEVDWIGWVPGFAECRNSWSELWGDQGHFWMPLEFLLGGYASDFRAISA